MDLEVLMNMMLKGLILQNNLPVKEISNNLKRVKEAFRLTSFPFGDLENV